MEKLMFYREWCRMYTLTNLEWRWGMTHRSLGKNGNKGLCVFQI